MRLGSHSIIPSHVLEGTTQNFEDQEFLSCSVWGEGDVGREVSGKCVSAYLFKYKGTYFLEMLSYTILDKLLRIPYIGFFATLASHFVHNNSFPTFAIEYTRTVDLFVFHTIAI